MDIGKAVHSHTRIGERPRLLAHKMVAQTPFSTSVFEEESLEVRFNFDTSGEPAAERSVVVSLAPDGSLIADMYRGGAPDEPRFRDASDWLHFVMVWRPSDRSLKIGFPKKRLGPDVQSYRWRAEVYGPAYKDFCGTSEDEPHGDLPPCYDKAGPLKHKL